MEIKILSKKTCQLNRSQILEICKLKNSYWKYGLKSNLMWFNNYTKKNDINNLMFINSKLVGYTLLRIRTFFCGNSKKKYLYFDTFILDKNFRGKSLSSFLMNANLQSITKSKKISFLICLKNMIKYYKKFGWEILSKKKFLIRDHKSNLSGMTINNKKNNKNLKFIFYFYS